MPLSDRQLSCRCGQFRASLAAAAPVQHIRCYCRDCQTYAHVLDCADVTLDECRGTHILATVQQYLSFTPDSNSLACISLSADGPLRWYAKCCDTPIANTARSPRFAYVGIVHTCLGGPVAVTAAYGPTRLSLHTKSGRGAVSSGVLDTAAVMARIMGPVLRARIDGGWKRGPFFVDHARPVSSPRILSPGEREQARRKTFE
ncbi:MAG: DUF6151 family protein [Steroidobacteraceae bacterium]